MTETARSGLVACLVATLLCVPPAQSRAQALAIPIDAPDPRLVWEVGLEFQSRLVPHQAPGIFANVPGRPPPRGWPVVIDGIFVGGGIGFFYALMEDVYKGLFADYDGNYLAYTVGGAVVGGGIGALLCLGWGCDWAWP